MTHTFATHIFDILCPRPAERFWPGDLHHFRGNHYAISSSSLFHPHPSRPKCTANHTLAVADIGRFSIRGPPPWHKCHWNGSFRLKGAILMWRPKKKTWWSFKEKHTLTCVMQSPIITWVGVRTIGKHSDTSLSNAFPPRIQKLPFQHLWFLQFFAEILHKSSGWGSNLSFIGSPPKMQVTLVEQCGNAALRSERCDEMVWNTRMICLDGFRKTWVTVT